MVLEGHVERSMLGFVRRVKVSAFCRLSQQIVAEPYVGCGQCHPLPPEFNEKIE
jgi:hypothetical protein